jgi:hypothetical protein
MKVLLTLIFLILAAGLSAQEDAPLLSDGEDKPKKEKKVKQKKLKKDTSDIITQPVRLEIKMDDSNDEFMVIEGGNNELLIAQNTKEIFDNGYEWKYYLVDEELNISWDVSMIQHQRFALIGYDYSHGNFYLFYENVGRRNQYRLVVIDEVNGSAVNHEVNVPFDITLTHFESLDKSVLIVGEYMYRPVGLIYNIPTNQSLTLPGLYNNNERIFDVNVDRVNRIFSFVLAERMLNGKYTNRIKSFTYDGLIIQENLIQPGEELSLLNGTTTNFAGGVQFVAGTYSTRNTLTSRGLYISKFTNGQQRFLRNYSYGEMENFFEFKGKRFANRMKKRAARKRANGKEPKFNYFLYVHGFVEVGDQNILVAEAYIPKYGYTMPYRIYYGPPGTSPYMAPYSYGYGSNYGMYPGYGNLLGYKFTHAIVVAFDPQGNIIWDNSFVTNDITSENLKHSVAVNVQDDQIVLMYLDRDLIKSKVVKGNEVVEGKTYNPVRLSFSGDKIRHRNSDIKGLESWYSNFLYAYGIQLVKNKSFPRKERSRRVFFINKIQFSDPKPDFGDFRKADITPPTTPDWE